MSLTDRLAVSLALPQSSGVREQDALALVLIRSLFAPRARPCSMTAGRTLHAQGSASVGCHWYFRTAVWSGTAGAFDGLSVRPARVRRTHARRFADLRS